MKLNLPTEFPLRTAAMLAVATLVATGCASKGVAPVSQLATSRAALTEAEAAGAGEHAPMDLLSAREKLNKAEAATRDEDYELARRYAEQAEADARLAAARARTAKSQKAVDEVQDGIKTLREGLQRNSK